MKPDVLLLAAGLGTRLRPLTLHTPKPLIELRGKALIEYHLERLSRAGVDRVIVNLHYLGDQIRTFIGNGEKWGISVEYSPEDPILDTGGAVKQIELRLQSDRLLLINSDLFLEEAFKIEEFLSQHDEKNDSITALVSKTASDEHTKLGVSKSGSIARFLSWTAPGGGELHDVNFLGMQIIPKSLLSIMPPAGSIFSITRDIWVRFLEGGGRIKAVEYCGYWSDIGTADRLEEASNWLKENGS